MKKTFIVGLSILGVLVLYAVGVFGWEMYVQATRLPQMEQEIGINVGTPEVDGNEVIQFMRVNENGSAYRAGLRRGDILDQSSLSEFTNTYFAADQSFTFSVLRDGQNVTITIEKAAP